MKIIKINFSVSVPSQFIFSCCAQEMVNELGHAQTIKNKINYTVLKTFKYKIHLKFTSI